MKLSVLERILLGNMLANHEGNFATLKLVRDVRSALSFNEEEVKRLNFSQNGNQLNWNSLSAFEIGEVEINIGETVSNIIKSTMKTLNDNSKLTDQHFSIYEKFIDG